MYEPIGPAASASATPDELFGRYRVRGWSLGAAVLSPLQCGWFNGIDTKIRPRVPFSAKFGWTKHVTPLTERIAEVCFLSAPLQRERLQHLRERHFLSLPTVQDRLEDFGREQGHAKNERRARGRDALALGQFGEVTKWPDSCIRLQRNASDRFTAKQLDKARRRLGAELPPNRGQDLPQRVRRAR